MEQSPDNLPRAKAQLMTMTGSRAAIGTEGDIATRQTAVDALKRV